MGSHRRAGPERNAMLAERIVRSCCSYPGTNENVVIFESNVKLNEKWSNNPLR